MTAEEKQLLLKDLCARLPYGVIVRVHDIKYRDFDSYINSISTTCVETYPVKELTIDFNPYVFYKLQDIKPYLRPMSSMTEEETKIYKSLQDSACSYHYEFGDIVDDILYFDNDVSLDYLNSIHVDYRGLIEKSLAIVAPEGMYES